MAQTGFFHHIGSFLLFAATILLVVTSISAPVVNDIALLKVHLGNATNDHKSALTFGTFGYCTIDTASGHDACSKAKVGYNAAAVVTDTINGSSGSGDVEAFSGAATRSAKALTRVMVLHPVAAGVAFLAFVLAAGAGVIGSFVGALVALVALLVTVVVLITDFVLFHLLKSHVRSPKSLTTANSRPTLDTKYGAAIWLVLAAAICLLLGTVVVFFSCCSARLHRSRGPRSSKVDPAYVAAPRRRRAWF